MAKGKSVFVCSECGHESARWLGKCPSCSAWNTLVEEVVVRSGSSASATISKAKVQKLMEVEFTKDDRITSGIGELDRVLGGGFVLGSVVLLGGDPGIGKSTLLLQACCDIVNAGKKVLYITGEESASQIKLRANRLSLEASGLYVLAENDLDSVLPNLSNMDFVVVDSIQTMNSSAITSSIGSVSQIKECSSVLIRYAKTNNTCMIFIGHVTKDGAIAGPKVLEHMVDTVLYFEGERHQSLRILRTVKNRFGSTNEVGVFEMTGAGMQQVLNPSEIFIGQGDRKEPGCVVVCCMEGTRPILIEIQALLNKTVYGQPRRMAAGVDYNRLVLLLAVMEKKLHLPTGGLDCYINVAGGLNIGEPGADLGVVVAIVSAIRDVAINKDACFIGEVGLTGEVRFVNLIEKRITECEKMGFTKCFIPQSNLKSLGKHKGIEIVGVETISQCLKSVF